MTIVATLGHMGLTEHQTHGSVDNARRDFVRSTCRFRRDRLGQSLSTEDIRHTHASGALGRIR